MASSAARFASCVSPRSRGDRPASARTRSALSPSEPSRAWKVTRFERRAARWRASASGPRRRRTRRRRGGVGRRARCRRVSSRDPRLSILATVTKQGSSLPLRVAHREIALVILHRRDQHLARQLEEARLELPGERDGHSTRAVTSSSSRPRSPPRRRRPAAASVTCRGSRARRRSKSASTLPRSRRVAS